MRLRTLILCVLLLTAVAACGESRTVTCSQSTNVLEDRATCTDESTSGIELWWNGLSPDVKRAAFIGAFIGGIQLIAWLNEKAKNQQSTPSDSV